MESSIFVKIGEERDAIFGVESLKKRTKVLGERKFFCFVGGRRVYFGLSKQEPKVSKRKV